MNKNALGNNELVRDFSADGTLFVYRDGDEHVVVSKGREHVDTWAETVPATLSLEDVEVGDSLWAIPDNWTEIVRVGSKTIYEIGAYDGYVEVEKPKKVRLRDADIRVTAVGDDLVTEPTNIEWDWESVENAIGVFEDDKTEHGRLVFNAFTKIGNHTDDIEAEVAEMATEPWVIDYITGGDSVNKFDSHQITLTHAEIDGRGLIADVAGLTDEEEGVLSVELTSKVQSPTVTLKME